MAMFGLGGPAKAADVEPIVTFDAAAGELPEGVAVDKRGTIYVSLPPIGQVRAIAPDGSQRTVATLPVDPAFGPVGGPLGLATDPRGNVYAAVLTSDPATRGVYRVAPDGAVTRLPGSGAIIFPNGLAFDKRGNLFVTDSILGAVWRIPRGGGAELWLQHPLLAGDDSAPLPFPLGANGIAYRHNALLVTNNELGSIVTIPIRPDGAPGTPSVLVQSPALATADGIALDVHGDLYVAVIAQSTVVRVSSDGTAITTLATASDGLDFPSSLAFGTGLRDRQTLFIVNFAIGPFFGFPPGSGPSLVALQAGVPGLPLP